MVDRSPIAGNLDTATPARSLLEKVLGRRETYEKYSPTDLKKIAQKYLSSVGLGDDVTFGAAAFDDLVKGRAKDYQGLKNAKTPNEDPIFKKLNEPGQNPAQQTARDAIKQAINDSLKTSPEFDDAQKKYTESAAVFKEYVQTIGQTRNVQDVLGMMQDYVDESKTAIEKQQKEEITSLTDKFDNDDAFKTSLKAALDITDAQLEDVKNSMLADLAETHKKQMDAFVKSSQESMNALHNAAAKQRQAFLFISSLHHNDQVMRREIARIAEENRNANSTQDMEISMSDDKADVKSVSLDQLKFIQLLGGGKIEKQKETNSYKLEIGATLFNPRYLGNDRHKRDMLVMAQAVRASGSEGIIMNVNFKHQATAEQRAREAFEACIKAGFPPEKIKLNVNGKLMTYAGMEKDGQKTTSISEGVYGKMQNEYNSLIGQSETIRKELADVLSTKAGQSRTNITSMKSEFEQLRQDMRSRTPPTPPAPDNSSSFNISPT